MNSGCDGAGQDFAAEPRARMALNQSMASSLVLAPIPASW
jgi:hypothetical protein